MTTTIVVVFILQLCYKNVIFLRNIYFLIFYLDMLLLNIFLKTKVSLKIATTFKKKSSITILLLVLK